MPQGPLQTTNTAKPEPGSPCSAEQQQKGKTEEKTLSKLEPNTGLRHLHQVKKTKSSEADGSSDRCLSF